MKFLAWWERQDWNPPSGSVRAWCTKEPAEKSSPGAEVFTDKERGQHVHRAGSVGRCRVGDSEPSLWAAAVEPGDPAGAKEEMHTGIRC